MGRDKVWDIQDVIFLRGGEGEKWRMGEKEMGDGEKWGWGETEKDNSPFCLCKTLASLYLKNC